MEIKPCSYKGVLIYLKGLLKINIMLMDAWLLNGDVINHYNQYTGAVYIAYIIIIDLNNNN